MKEFLNEQNLNKLDKIIQFKKTAEKIAHSYKFQSVFVSENQPFAVLRFNPLYQLILTEFTIDVKCSSGMKGADWTKTFNHDELPKLANFLAHELNYFPIN